MAFEDHKYELIEELIAMGAHVEEKGQNSRLVVNHKYEICYTNYWYWSLGQATTLGCGHQSFLRLIRQEMTQPPQPLVTFQPGFLPEEEA